MTGAAFSDGEIAELFRPLEGITHAALAVSGGADSMALMHLAARWRLGNAVSTSLTVLSVDHGLRPEAADEAARAVEVAKALGLGAALLRWEGAKPATGIQAAARAARYDLMAQYAHAHGVGALVTAHQLDDQAETLVMRLARGSGVDGLSGIPERSSWAGISLLRPLLGVPGARLRDMLREDGIGWSEDPSNRNPRYERVRVRAALEELEKLGITGEALARSARRLARARAALDEAAETFIAAHCRISPAGYCAIDRAAFCATPEEIAVRALGRVVRGVGGTASRIHYAKLEALASALRVAGPVARTLSGCRIDASDEGVTVTREPGRAGLHELRVRPGECALWDRRFTVSLSDEAPSGATVRALGRKGLGLVRARGGKPIQLPGAVAAGLAAFWRAGEVIAVPALGFTAEGTEGPEGRFRSEFVALGLLAGRSIKGFGAKASPHDGHEGMKG